MESKCDWCGKRIDTNNSVHDGILITPHHFCSKKCQAEYHANQESRKSDNTSYESESTGFFGLIWKVVKWVIIITIIWFVYDNYLK
ncbi:MAG: hypothetical protein MJZ91_07865 [Bacteroidales bacterium]|nr:hypothetical protein [Bacteroidales bacterium]